MAEAFAKFKESFTFNFIEGSRWKYITNGLLVTLKVTFFAVLIGLMIGVVVALSAVISVLPSPGCISSFV